MTYVVYKITYPGDSEENRVVRYAGPSEVLKLEAIAAIQAAATGIWKWDVVYDVEHWDDNGILVCEEEYSRQPCGDWFLVAVNGQSCKIPA